MPARLVAGPPATMEVADERAAHAARLGEDVRLRGDGVGRARRAKSGGGGCGAAEGAREVDGGGPELRNGYDADGLVVRPVLCGHVSVL